MAVLFLSWLNLFVLLYLCSQSEFSLLEIQMKCPWPKDLLQSLPVDRETFAAGLSANQDHRKRRRTLLRWTDLQCVSVCRTAADIDTRTHSKHIVLPELKPPWTFPGLLAPWWALLSGRRGAPSAGGGRSPTPRSSGRPARRVHSPADGWRTAACTPECNATTEVRTATCRSSYCLKTKQLFHPLTWKEGMEKLLLPPSVWQYSYSSVHWIAVLVAKSWKGFL